MADIALRWLDGAADLAVENDDLAGDAGLRTAVVLSLFADRRAEADDDLPADDGDRRGWWVDELAPVEGDRIGSRLWLLDRAKRTEAIAPRAEDLVREALAWMLEDRVASRVDVAVEVAGAELAIAITVHRAEGDPVALRFAHVWAEAPPPVEYPATINRPPIADFDWIRNALTVTFTDLSDEVDGQIVAWAWSFGDNHNSSEQNPVHSYAAPGSYFVTLTVTDDEGLSHSVQAEVTANQVPVANFTWSNVGLVVAFTDTSTDPNGQVVAWLWDFGDGTASTARNPSKTFLLFGAKVVTLTVTDNDGDTNTVIRSISLDVFRDGPASIAIPQSAADFGGLGLPVPDFLWLCQDASGALQAAIGGQALAVGATGQLYQQTMSGWTRKFVGLGEIQDAYFASTAAIFGMGAAESFAVIVFAAVARPAVAPPNFGAILGIADGPNNGLAVDQVGVFQTRHNGVATYLDSPHADAGSPTNVRPYVWFRRADTNESGCVTEQQRKLGTHDESAIANTLTGLGDLAPAGSNRLAPQRVCWLAIYRAANAERDWKAYLTNLGWTLDRIPRDGPANVYVPCTAQHFAALGLPVPDWLYTCQEASGDMVPSLYASSSVNLTKIGSGHLYQQSVAGWSRRFLGLPQTAGVGWVSTNSLFALASGESFAIVALLAIGRPSGSNQIGAASGGNAFWDETSGQLTSVHNNVSAPSSSPTADPTATPVTVRPLVWYRRADIDESGLLTDQEKVLGTHEEIAHSANVSLGASVAGNTPPPLRAGWYAIYKGVNAERDWQAYLTTLGWELNKIPRDGPGSAIYCPQTVAHFTKLGLAAPDHLWTCQCASGDVESPIGGTGLVGAGSPLRGQTVSGWSRLFVGLPETADNMWWNNSSLFAATAGQSWAMLAYGAVARPVAAAGWIWALGAGSNGLTMLSSGLLRSWHNNVQVTFTTASGDVGSPVTVRPWLWYRNATTNVSGAMTNLESKLGTHDESAFPLRMGLGDAESGGTTPAAPARYCWAALWKGANAERDWKAYLQTLGWTLSF